ncbi:hypothetical protein, partial [Rhizobium ruizarguesonis]|uniref:hypothetical protein n=1 Tax=Rhizobium ruizarguesonis TaxID=2081791 RepID=UPI0019543A3C
QISQYDQDIACGQLKSDRNPSKNRTPSSRLRQRSANFSSLLEQFQQKCEAVLPRIAQKQKLRVVLRFHETLNRSKRGDEGACHECRNREGWNQCLGT